MASFNALIMLIRQEFNWKRLWPGRPAFTRWTVTYLTLFIVVGIGFFTYVTMQGNVQIEYMWFFTFGAPWMVFGWSIYLINREWQHRTFGWWLALPYSRSTLIMAKFWTGLLQGIAVFIFFFAIVMLLSLYGKMLPGNTLGDISVILLWGLRICLLLTSTLPFMAAAGILFGTLTQSRKKPIMPLLGISLWVVMGFGFYGLLSIGNGETNIWTLINEGNSTADFPINPTLIVGIALSWIVAWLMLVFASRVLERDLNV